jgi:hypothetical protein
MAGVLTIQLTMVVYSGWNKGFHRIGPTVRMAHIDCGFGNGLSAWRGCHPIGQPANLALILKSSTDFECGQATSVFNTSVRLIVHRRSALPRRVERRFSR